MVTKNNTEFSRELLTNSDSNLCLFREMLPESYRVESIVAKTWIY
jgi:hypothetical protein